MITLNPMVVDLSHHNVSDNGGNLNFAQAKAFGIRGVIYKATEGMTYVDPTYERMREAATKVGMLWGAYHFFRPGDIYKQVKHFVDTAKPVPGTLMVLDHEDAGCSASMAESFLRSLEQIIKRKGAIYSGHLIKDQLGNQVNDYLGSCRLWLAQYGPTPTCQASWNKFWLWQFTGDGLGPEPHNVPGLGRNIDINHFQGTYDDLVAQWVDGPDLDDAFEPIQTDITRWVQATLNLLGEHPQLVVDGSFGTLTKTALAKYQLENELEITNQPDKDTITDLLDMVGKWNDQRTVPGRA